MRDEKNYSVSYRYTISPVTGKWIDVGNTDTDNLKASAEAHHAAWEETRALMQRLVALPIPKNEPK